MTRILRMKQAIEKTGLSRSSIYNLMADGQFPRSIKISERAAGWVEDDIEAYLAAVISGKGREHVKELVASINAKRKPLLKD